MKIYALTLLISLSSWCQAQTGADVLLDELAVQGPAVATKTPGALLKFNQPKDAFQQQLLLTMQNNSNLPFDVRQWGQYVFAADYAKAAHLWTAIQTQIPDEFRDMAAATQVYLLWKLGLHQTFLDEWIKNLKNERFAQSAAEFALEGIITQNLDSWLLSSAVLVSPEQREILLGLPATKPFVTTLRAWSDLRNQATVEDILPKIAPENKLARFVAQTAVYAHVKQNDLKGAAKILKTYVEPTIEVSRDMDALAVHDLSIARILYQAGQMAAAREFYQKVPNRSPSYMAAREELAWVELRLGDMARLRGELTALSSPVFKDRFQPEVYLLKSVSDLKMCFYDNLEKDLADFGKNNATWAKQIDAALESSNPPAPTLADEYTRMSEKTKASVENEIKALADLREKSIGATLPAVGPQQHWKDYGDHLLLTMEAAKKRTSDEYRRQWHNQKTVLQEAIRKMRFVKVEYLSQVRQLAAAGTADPQTHVASNSTFVPAETLVQGDKDKLNFSATTEIWPDELFKLRSAAQAQCLKKRGAQ